MHIHCLGLNHTTADVQLRERLAFSDDSIKAALARLGCGMPSAKHPFTEMVILSTCNRVEVYALSAYEDFGALEDFLSEVKGQPRDEFQDHVYRYLDDQAVTHLFRVAAGLDSLVLGEPQILGQVMHAFEMARGQNSAGPVLSRLFQTALRVGKRARSETAIGQNPASISSMAVRLAEKIVSDLPAADILVIGAGEMAELCVEALRKRGVKRVTVVNRTRDRAQGLAGRWGGTAMTFENLPAALQGADVLIASTSAPHTVISTEMVTEAMRARSERPLFVIDIAVPRDVDTQAGEIPGVSLYDIDALQQHLSHSLNRRAQEIPNVEAILVELKVEFNEYLKLLEVFPLIAEMHQRAESIRQTELRKTLRRLPDLSEAERLHLEALTQALVKKILHAPITRLRNVAGSPEAAEYATTMRALFDLQVNPVSNAGPGNGENE
jgi:glutamyl-tRNA reductase